MRIWQRVLVRCGIVVCALPTTSPAGDLDRFLVAHFRCKQCRQQSESPIIDPCSQSERFACQYCGTEYSSRKITGEPLFRIAELAEQYLRSHPREAAAIKAGHPPAGLLWRILFSRREPLPPHRNGQTLGELEADAVGKFAHIIINHPSLFK